MLFSLVTLPLEKLVKEGTLVRQLWYLDDALLYGMPHEVARALDILLVALHHIDLEINFTKCELYSDGTCALPESLRRVPLVPDVSKSRIISRKRRLTVSHYRCH